MQESEKVESAKPEGNLGAWEPLTPKGVAAFAGAPLVRLFGVQFLVAVIAALMVLFLENRAWFPVIAEAVHQMPEYGQIYNGKLAWSGENSVQLAQNEFLGVAVDLYHSGKIGRESHLQFEFGEENLRIYSLLGYQVCDYPKDLDFPFNQADLEPWWGAWQPMFKIGTAIVVIVSLMLSWAVLASLYCVPVWVISFLLNRDLGWRQSWKLAGACLMPGALFLSFGIFAYAENWMDLIHLGGMMGMHFVIAWIYLFVGPLFCRRAPEAELTVIRKNPFVLPASQTADEVSTSKPREAGSKKNPFS